MGSLDTILCCRIPLLLKQKIEAHRVKFHLETTTKATIDLLSTGLFVAEKREMIADPQVVEYLRQRLYDERLVDWIYGLPSDRLEALFATFASARQERYRTKH